MVKKIGIILFFVAAVGARHAVPLQGLPLLSDTAFADSYTQDSKPCPPECVSDSMEIVTWYPSPYNEYEELRLYPVQRDDNYCTNDKIGLMYYDDGGTPSFGDDDKMRVCKGTLLGWKEVGGGNAEWTSSITGSLSANIIKGYYPVVINGSTYYLGLYADPNQLLTGGSTHLKDECLSSGGSLYNIGGGNYICRFSGGGCPSGWLKYSIWSKTVATSCGTAWQQCTSCTTGYHNFSDQPVEACGYCGMNCWPQNGGCPAWTCSATITEIGCV